MKEITLEEFDKKFVDFFECEREYRLPRVNADPLGIERFVRFIKIKENITVNHDIETIFNFMMGKHNDELIKLEKEMYGPIYRHADATAW